MSHLSAYDEGKRSVGGQRVLPRDSLVGAALWHRYQQDEVRRLRLRWRCVEILPRWRRVLNDTVDLGPSAQPKVNFNRVRSCVQTQLDVLCRDYPSIIIAFDGFKSRDGEKIFAAMRIICPRTRDYDQCVVPHPKDRRKKREQFDGYFVLRRFTVW